jgi:type I restriction enzyme R subunit
LRKSVNIDRRLSLREILEKIFGKIKKFKSKDELLEEEVDKFISIYHPEPKMIYIIRQFIKAYILDNQLREIIDKGEFQDLATNPRFDMKDMQELGREWREKAVEYIKDYVPLNTFTT